MSSEVVGGGGEKKGMSSSSSSSSYNLVEEMGYLYVRVVKARDLPRGTLTGSSCDPYVEVRMGNYKGKTKYLEKKTNPEWNQVFAFSKPRIQSSVLEIMVRDRQMIGVDECIGKVTFDMHEVPTRLPPNTPLAPQWYPLDNNPPAQLMAALWMGTQADDSFPQAWHSDSATLRGHGLLNARSMVYLSPKLWYLRLNIIEAQDIVPFHQPSSPLLKLFVKAQIGKQVVRTRVSETKPSVNPFWNEDLLFVAAEPFEEHLTIKVQNKTEGASSKDELLGRLDLPLHLFEKRLDHRPVLSHWFDLQTFGFGLPPRHRKFATKIHLRVCLEGGYHVLDESTLYSSDHRPTARQLWRSPVAVLELGILGARGLAPMKKNKGRETTDAYCVAKYGEKWVRTRTIVEEQSPRWNEQYTWEVYDQCTVITMAVMDNCHLGREEEEEEEEVGEVDSRMGKIRIRISTLETGRVYREWHPLMMLNKTAGVKRMGEVEVAVIEPSK